MITLKELNVHNHPTNKVIDANLQVLLQRMNELRAAWNKPMIITSGLRSEENQRSLMEQGKTKAFFSNHLAGAACDVLDKKGALAKWCLKNEDLLKRIGLWCEHPDYTKGWMHFQILPPRSGNRFFIP